MLRMHKLLDKLSILSQQWPICKYFSQETILNLDNIGNKHQKTKMIKGNKMMIMIIINQMMEMEEMEELHK